MKKIAKFHKVSFEQFAEGFADYSKDLEVVRKTSKACYKRQRRL